MRLLPALMAVALGTFHPVVPGLVAPAAAQGGQKQITTPDTTGITIVYPKEGSSIAASSTFLVGSIAAGEGLTCDDAPVKLSPEGYFAHTVKLKPGKNTFKLARASAPEKVRLLTLLRDVPPVPLLPAPLKMVPESAEPREDLGLTPGDIVGLSLRASPGSKVEALIGGRRIALIRVAGLKGAQSHAINRGIDAAYGLSFQRFPRNLTDLYCGFYKVSPSDRLTKAAVRFVVTKGKRTLTATARGRVTSVADPWLAQTLHDATIVRLGPGEARTTPLPAAVRVLVDGWQGTSMRCLVSPGRHVWIVADELSALEKAPFIPACVVRTVNVRGEDAGARIAVPLADRLPFQIEQQLKPNKLVLRIFGATSDTDWITDSLPLARQDLIDHVTWRQAQDKVYELTVQLAGHRQWGFSAEYEDNTLVLHVKGPPHLVAGKEQLSGLVVCVDPGHGGDETGSMGPSGVRESTVNLGIGLKLKDLLEKEGATVILTRKSDAETVSLADRVATAVANRADLLISVHNNALPDGRDPWSEHGTSSYWYHPQAIEFARALKAGVLTTLKFPDFGTYYQNLALTRPSNMLAALVEVGFMINPPEYAELIKPETQRRAAEGILKGITDYITRAQAEPPRE